MTETATERNARKNKEAITKLDEYKEKGFHMLVPAEITIDDIMEGFALTVSEPVYLAPHPKDRDVYAHVKAQYDWEKDDWRPGNATGKQLVRFHKAGYYKLARAANIEWVKPGIIHDTSGKDLRVYADTAALYRTHEGNYYQVPDGKGIDMEAVKLTKPKEYNKIRENIDQLCITGAKLRCIRQVFVLCLPEIVPVDYLKVPFVAVKILPFLDYSDPYTKKLLIQMQVASMAGIYGIGAPVAQPEQISYTAGTVDPAKCVDDPDVIDIPEEGAGKPYRLDKSQTMQQEEDVPFGLENKTPTSAESLRADFEACEAGKQANVLAIMVTAKGQQDFTASWLKGFKKQPATMENIGPANRLKLYDHLVSLPDVEKGKVAA